MRFSLLFLTLSTAPVFLAFVAPEHRPARVAGIAAPSQEKVLVNVDKDGVALQGYDPVAFQAVGRPVPGRSDLAVTFLGAIYRFSTAEHQALFEGSPETYVPRFGGFCAYGLSRGYTAPVDITTWQIVDGRLILNYSPAIKERFDLDRVAYLRKAEANWPVLVDKEGKATP